MNICYSCEHGSWQRLGMCHNCQVLTIHCPSYQVANRLLRPRFSRASWLDTQVDAQIERLSLRELYSPPTPQV